MQTVVGHLVQPFAAGGRPLPGKRFAGSIVAMLAASAGIPRPRYRVGVVEGEVAGRYAASAFHVHAAPVFLPTITYVIFRSTGHHAGAATGTGVQVDASFPFNTRFSCSKG